MSERFTLNLHNFEYSRTGLRKLFAGESVHSNGDTASSCRFFPRPLFFRRPTSKRPSFQAKDLLLFILGDQSVDTGHTQHPLRAAQFHFKGRICPVVRSLPSSSRILMWLQHYILSIKLKLG